MLVAPPPTLGALGLKIRRHWQEQRPKMTQALQSEGKLDRAVHAAEQLTLQAEAQAIQQGMSPDQARELTRQEWAFLPSEADVPHLGSEPRMWSAAPLDQY